MSKTNTPRRALSKGYLKSTVTRSEIEQFKSAYSIMIDQLDSNANEEFLKNLVRDFLLNAYYKGKHLINVEGRKDLVIHNGPKAKDSIGVIMEVKSINNRNEMVTKEDLNKKALQELILYYLREREDNKNIYIKHLIITNSIEWFVIDGVEFEKQVFRNVKLIKGYRQFKNSGQDTKFFYTQIAKPFIETIKDDLSYTWFNMVKFKNVIKNEDQIDDSKLISLFKFLSPTHILKQPFGNDSNTLNRNFYNELLHIIGLEEVKIKNKKLIRRKEEAKREPASLVENAINILKYESNVIESQRYDTALELSITWINRILFLKLLESQLVKYHKGDKEYKFLNYEKIKDYDTLNRLFFQVLAIEPQDRRPKIKEAYNKVPYLNSSLFEVNDLEFRTLKISNLEDDNALSIPTKTVLKDSKGKLLKGQLNTLEYLFRFLEAYDFSSEGGEQIQEENKTLINASVLGLIFEKINGYKDGSFFTPGFITMYMCKETIRRAVIQKFKDHTDFESDEWDDLIFFTSKASSRDVVKKYNDLIDSLKICDPAVGSGHYLVSALNEIIAIKSELQLLSDEKGMPLQILASVDNDELIIQNKGGDNELIEYNFKNKNSHHIQKTLFIQKQTIIENCLFGVDINPNSVKICRLRLWIELLKNAYYTEESNYTDLETLPNIDINIKCGNSLISRFDLTSDLKPALKKSKFDIDGYKVAVSSYKQATDKEQKREFQKLIKAIKSDFRSDVRGKEIRDLQKLEGQFYDRFGQATLIDVELTKTEIKKKAKEQKKLQDKIDKKKIEIEEIRNNKIYENAFEWRFEFPEVLDDEGDYIGFDAVIGNPPYFSLTSMQTFSDYLSKTNFLSFNKRGDIYFIFIERGCQIVKQSGIVNFIISNSWLRASYAQELREYIITNTNLYDIINFEDWQLFDEATVETCIISIAKNEKYSYSFYTPIKEDFHTTIPIKEYLLQNGFSVMLKNEIDWILEPEHIIELMTKIEQESTKIYKLPIKINFGIKTGMNDAFIIDEETKSKLEKLDSKSQEIIVPIIRGRDLSKYKINFSNYYLINTHNGIKSKGVDRVDASEYSSIITHLESYLPKVKKRTDQGSHWSNLRNCAYLDDFKKDKIVWGEISDKPKFAFDNNEYFAEATTFFMIGDGLLFILGILNSKLSEWYFNLIGTTTGMGTNRWKKYKIELFPIKKVSNNKRFVLERLVNQVLDTKALNPDEDTSSIESAIDRFVYELYELDESEIQLIEEAVK